METTYHSVIEQIAQSIFSTMLNKYLVRVEEPTRVDCESLLATVQISGQWMGSVVLALSSDAAQNVAATMLQISENDVTDVDKQDVAAELANMIGGNLKSLLPAPSFLSLPTIVSGSDFGLRMHNAQLIDDVVLSGDVGVLRIRLYAKPL